MRLVSFYIDCHDETCGPCEHAEPPIVGGSIGCIWRCNLFNRKLESITYKELEEPLRCKVCRQNDAIDMTAREKAKKCWKDWDDNEIERELQQWQTNEKRNNKKK